MLEHKTYDLTGDVVRPYEMSIWTLTDDFITILKPMGIDYFGTIQNALIDISDDGTEELNFSIPIYIMRNNELVENPVWRDAYLQLIITNMKKVKVIFNKGRDEERVFEFVIDSIVETHGGNILTCDVKCGGLAFHELGKLGYKVVFSPEEFYLKYEEWFELLNSLQNETIELWNVREPKATIDFWNDLMGIEKFSSDTIPLKNKWYYVVNIDLSSYENAAERASDKIYEEPYVSSWTADLTPEVVQASKEKARLMDMKESNFYNLSLELAKTFGVFCKYEYDYDENYHIKSRKIVYYNNFINDKEGTLNFSYPYLTSEISRTLDSYDLITKLYVRDVDNNEGLIVSITETEVNKTREDYILNFDYMREIGTMSQELYLLVHLYEKDMADNNKIIMDTIGLLNVAENKKIEVEAKITYYTNSIALDKERISEANALIENIDALLPGSSTESTYSVNESAPKTGILITEDITGYYTLNISEKGLKYDTLRIYGSYKYGKQTVQDENGLSKEVTVTYFDDIIGSTAITSPGVPVYDEFNNLIKVIHINGGTLSKNTVYLKYDYSPKLYYSNIRDIWVLRQNLDENSLALLNIELETLEAKINSYQRTKDNTLAAKKEIIDNFNNTLGSIIREGYWIPDTYESYDTQCKEELHLPLSANNITNGSKYVKLFWDDTIEDDELDIKYLYGTIQEEKSYLCIDLSNYLNTCKDYIDNLSVLFYDYEATAEKLYTTTNARYYTANANCQYGIICADNLNPIPVLILTESGNLTDKEITYLEETIKIGIITTTTDNQNNTTIDFTELVSHANVSLINFSNLNNPRIIYPRFEIDSTYLATDSDSLKMSYNNIPLKIYEDFYVFSRVLSDNNTASGKYYVTIKPKTLLKLGNLYDEIRLIYNISNVNAAIYLDAKEVAKENSKPKVSYSIKLNCLNEKFLHTAYNMLNRIILINDVELHFNLVFGYISKLSLNLDFPWEDNVEVKNYKNKFEDLFSSIIALTELAQKSEYMDTTTRSAFNPDGTITMNALLLSIDSNNIKFSFNNNKLNLTENDGLLGTDDSGKIAFRSNGIFVASTKDNNGEWVWRNAISPKGIHPESIISGKLDMKNITIQSGDSLKFLLNAEGLFAFKSYTDDKNLMKALNHANKNLNTISLHNDMDCRQYVVHNSKGLFLTVKAGAYVFTGITTDNLGNEVYNYTTVGLDINRVEVSWNGLIIRNWANLNVFWADTEGNLHLKGIIEALQGGTLAGWNILAGRLDYGSGDTYVAILAPINTDYVIWAGNDYADLAPFAIKKDGTIIMNKAEFGIGGEEEEDEEEEGTSSNTGIVVRNGTIGYNGQGLTIINRGLTDGHLGFIKTSSRLYTIGFWAGSNHYPYTNNDKVTIDGIEKLMDLYNDPNIKFRIYRDGTSKISLSEISESSISNTSINSTSIIGEETITINNVPSQKRNFELTSTGQCTIKKGTISENVSINLHSSENPPATYCTITTAGVLSAKGATLDISSLTLNGTTSCISNNNKILTSAIENGSAIDSIANILNGQSTLALDHVLYGNDIQNAIDLVSSNSSNVKIGLNKLDTSSSNTNIYNVTNYSISSSLINIKNGYGLELNLTDPNLIDDLNNLLENPHSLIATIQLINNVDHLSISLCGQATIYSGQIGIFNIVDELAGKGLRYSDLNIYSGIYKDSIIYRNAANTETYFKLSSSGVETKLLKITTSEASSTALNIVYTELQTIEPEDPNDEPTILNIVRNINITAGELTALKELTGLNLDSRITALETWMNSILYANEHSF